MKVNSHQVNGSLGLGISAVILGITALSSPAIAKETVLTCTAGQYQTKVEYDSLSSNYTDDSIFQIPDFSKKSGI